MSAIPLFTAMIPPPVLPEEEIAMAEAQLAEMNGAGGSFLSDHTGWVIFFAIMAVAVVLMLIMLAGRYRRQRDSAGLAEEPLFDGDDMVAANGRDGGFAEVLIEEDPEEHTLAHVMETDVAYDDAEEQYDEVGDDGEEDAVEDEEFVAARADRRERDEVRATRDEERSRVDDDTEDDEDLVDDDAANVVPLRGGERMRRGPSFLRRNRNEEIEEDLYEEPAEAVAEERSEAEEAPTRRYAFATGRAAASEANFGRSTYAANEPRDPEPQERATMSHAGNEDGDRPYVAPFIREDIERAEQRQAERIDSLRRENEAMRREFSSEFEAIRNEQSHRLDLAMSSLDRKLDRLISREPAPMPRATERPESSDTARQDIADLNMQVDRITSMIDGQGQRIRAITNILESKLAEVGRVYDEVKFVRDEVKSIHDDVGETRTTVSTVHHEVDEVKEHVGRLERAILERAAQDSSMTVRLADVVRGTLPEGAYEFNATLENGETVDCLLNFEGISHRVAIDAGFPIEAFNQLPSRDAVRRNLPQAKAAEDSFRRSILRSILEAADRCIAPEETAESCLLFLPSEAAYTILHDRFPDLVRDSQRAHVWLVSPSTLMGTLHLVRSLLPDTDTIGRRHEQAEQARAREEEDARLREEVEVLRRRAANLSEELERTRGTLRGLIGPGERSRDTDDDELFREEEPRRPASRPEPKPVTQNRGESHSVPDPEDEMIDGLSFEGTPDWRSPSVRPEPTRPRSGLPNYLENDEDDYR